MGAPDRFPWRTVALLIIAILAVLTVASMIGAAVR